MVRVTSEWMTIHMLILFHIVVYVYGCEQGTYPITSPDTAPRVKDPKDQVQVYFLRAPVTVINIIMC